MKDKKLEKQFQDTRNHVAKECNCLREDISNVIKNTVKRTSRIELTLSLMVMVNIFLVVFLFYLVGR